MNPKLLLLIPLFTLAGCGTAATPAADEAGAAAVDEASARPAKAGLCVACHGQYGVSGLPGHPHIAGQDETYLRESMLRYRSGERPHAPMKAVVGGLSDADIAALARYYAQLPRDGLGPREKQ
ncbi:c-type cytochrome [Pseudomarimonas salicorniae]|uniref:Cytochrome C n=1 Tax=Pseudomarimonas salicorniae TaxID=2933270 RepID=A0ABT0GHB8_9GAMM|nr:cytochrome C [Lysobacter sp. CAU 1642]MCK7593928.1 cytochrome C [Lysobacter sp. CAU 1642]